VFLGAARYAKKIAFHQKCSELLAADFREDSKEVAVVA
jgi:hypothetical protein